MYASFYKLNLDPFRLTPDPQFFYASQTHQRGLSYLRYAFYQQEGFVVITGAPGTGKTELMLNLINGLPQNKVILSKIVTANLQADDLLELVAASFLKPVAGTGKGLLLKQLEDFFISQRRAGKQILLLIDEAHNLSTKALIELSMLSNFQVNARPVMQCFLMGQEPLEQKLEQPELAHLKQRIIASTHLQSLDAQETHVYIDHRLRIANWKGDPSISDSTYALIHDFTSGIPRRINVLCSRMLLEAYLEEKHHIDVDLVYRVVGELEEEDLTPQSRTPQMSMTLDFSNSSRQSTDSQPTPITDHTPQKIRDSSAESPPTMPETGNIVDNNNFNHYHSVSLPLQSGIAAAWPSEEDDQTVTPNIPVINQTRNTSSDLEVNSIPDNVHALFKQQATHTAMDNEGLVVNFPVEEDAEVDIDFEILDTPQEPFIVDTLSQEQHRLLNSSDEDRVTKTPPSPRNALASLQISSTGLMLSITILMVLWWFTYGSGSFYLMQLLHRISSIVG